jgi:predicted ATPase
LKLTFSLSDVLTQGRRTDLLRHQSLRATLDWSHALLTDSEQTVFRRLAALPGKFTLGDAVRVARNGTQSVTTMIEILAALVAKSLVVADHAANAEPEYYLLGTTRAYSLAKLIESGEIETVRRRHAEGDQEIAEGQTAEIAEREAMTYSSLACELEEIGCVVRPQDDSATRVALIGSSVSTHDWQRQTRPRAVLKYA